MVKEKVLRAEVIKGEVYINQADLTKWLREITLNVMSIETYIILGGISKGLESGSLEKE